MEWSLILIALAAIIIFVVSRLIHFRHMKHRIGAIVLILIGLFFFLTFMGVVTSNSIKLNSFGSFFHSIGLYFSWLGHVLSNLRVITGSVVRMDWMPVNMTS